MVIKKNKGKPLAEELPKEFYDITKITPQAFLETISDTDSINTYKKDIILQLRYTTLELPKELQKKISETRINLGLVAVVGEQEYDDRINSLNTQHALLDILRQFGIIKEYKLKQDSYKPTDPDDMLALETFVFADIKFYPLKAISYYENHFQKDKKYWIDYTSNRAVILNGKYLINKMQFARYTDMWFEYISKNPNKQISLEEIRNGTKQKGDNFINFLNNTKFKGQLRELFFEQGKNSIKFNNPITEEDLSKRLINVKELEKEIRQLKKIEKS